MDSGPLHNAPPTTPAPILSLRGISKSFGAVQALMGVSLEVYPHEVVAIVGDNGAGKSTLVKVLAGVHTHDSGAIAFHGDEVTVSSPADSHRLGIATIYQDLALCDNLDVVSNLFLGNEQGGMVLDEVAMEQRSVELIAQLSGRFPSVRTAVAALSGGQRQAVAIARALIGSPSVVVLDEPTAALGVAQTAEVLNLIERLREQGHGVILISHNMEDVRSVADRVVVLRLGKNNGTFNVSDVSNEEIITAITGAADNAASRRSENAMNGAPGE